MKSKIKIRTIEDIAIQYIKRAEPRKQKEKEKKDIINSYKTLIDYKFNIKNNKLLENKENIQLNGNNKIIKLYKIPQKNLKEEDDSFNAEFNANNESNGDIISKKTIKFISGDDIKLRDIIDIKFNINNSNKLFFNLSYQNIYDSITEVYFPIIQNFESISSLKSMTNNTLSCIEFFSNHDSVFDLISQNNNGINNNNILIQFLDQLKIYEYIEMNLVLFIMHIISEIKIEYIDNFNEDDIFIIYKDCFSVLQKFYEIIILIIKKSLAKKYLKKIKI